MWIYKGVNYPESSFVTCILSPHHSPVLFVFFNELCPRDIYCTADHAHVMFPLLSGCCGDYGHGGVESLWWS